MFDNDNLAAELEAVDEWYFSKLEEDIEANCYEGSVQQFNDELEASFEYGYRNFIGGTPRSDIESDSNDCKDRDDLMMAHYCLDGWDYAFAEVFECHFPVVQPCKGFNHETRTGVVLEVKHDLNLTTLIFRPLSLVDECIFRPVSPQGFMHWFLRGHGQFLSVDEVSKRLEVIDLEKQIYQFTVSKISQEIPTLKILSINGNEAFSQWLNNTVRQG
ncbi:hypothetical protein AB6E94_19060 [Vibrio lentus]|uniref:hypothetical protein n=1 Tax=Vibrio splendidus TaxID=29497 RepID=UPI000C837111|nr:hypothetical protein [Vibrio splendidus]PMG17801.1 hypothetical protein BCU98_00280 [Vibrio splendidus]